MGKKARIDVRPTVFVLLLGAFLVVAPGSTLAAQDGDYTYTTSGSPAVATITGYTGAGGAITIPSTLGGYPVVAITGSYVWHGTWPTNYYAYEGAFQDKALTSVVIPSSVTSIGLNAFYECTSLTAVTIPSNVTSIGEAAFYSCQSLTSVTIGSGVTTIGDYALEQCTSLSSISFLGLVAPTTVGDNWINGTTHPGIRGHAYTASNFPAPGGVWNGLTMGATLDGNPDGSTTSDMTVLILVAVIAIAVVLVAVLLFMRKKK
jgi:hypothetical protein